MTYIAETCIIIPVYNEFKRLQSYNIFQQIHKSNFTFLFVDDGSIDQTYNLLVNQLSGLKNITLIKLDHNQGKAEAVRIGMLAAAKEKKFKYIGFLDADLSTPLFELEKMVGIIQNQNNLVMCSAARWRRLGSAITRSPLRHFLGRIFATFASFALGDGVYDTQCGCKIFKSIFVEAIFNTKFVSRWIFDLEIFFRLKKINQLKTICYEYPLGEWTERKGTKIKISDIFFNIPIDFIKVWFNYHGFKRN
jgi:dolichyl-phosphate beta-glucosyltransferase